MYAFHRLSRLVEPNSTVRPVTYGLVTVIKKAIILANQRDINVTDKDSNLLYTVKLNPGPIAGFDVLGSWAGNTATSDDTVDL